MLYHTISVMLAPIKPNKWCSSPIWVCLKIVVSPNCHSNFRKIMISHWVIRVSSQFLDTSHPLKFPFNLLLSGNSVPRTPMNHHYHHQHLLCLPSCVADLFWSPWNRSRQARTVPRASRLSVAIDVYPRNADMVRAPEEGEAIDVENCPFTDTITMLYKPHYMVENC